MEASAPHWTALKRGTGTDKANYRPVSILTTLSKVFEKIIYDQLWSEHVSKRFVL